MIYFRSKRIKFYIIYNFKFFYKGEDCLKIVFMGTPKFAAVGLEKLINNHYNIVAVFTKADKPKGRGYKVEYSEVKQLALNYGLIIHQPVSLKKPEVIQAIKDIDPDLIVVIAYGRILPKEILEIPRLGCINIHGSLLPKYRGAAPVQWSVINGEKYAGVTSMFMDEGLDTGNMILQEKLLINQDETSGELLERLSYVSAETLIKTLKLFESGNVKRIIQNDEESTIAPILQKELSYITFNKPALEVHNMIRGINPWPIAKVNFKGKILKVYRTKVYSVDDHNKKPGEILDNQKFIVSCSSGSLEFLEVQVEGGKKMSGRDFLLGHKINVGDFILEKSQNNKL